MGGLAGYGVTKKLQAIGKVSKGKKYIRSGAILGGLTSIAALGKFGKKSNTSKTSQFINDYYSNIDEGGDWIDGTKIDRKFRKKYKAG